MRDLIVPGLMELQDQLQTVLSAVERINKLDISVGDLCTDDFIREYTHHDTLDAFIDAADADIFNPEDPNEIDFDKLDAYVRRSTEFDSWDSLIRAAARAFILNQLFGPEETSTAGTPAAETKEEEKE